MAAVRNTGTRLDVTVIVGAALEIAREHGVGAVRMREVADRLGVTPMAIYHYVETKELLVKLVADAVVGRVKLPSSGETDWRRQLTGAMEDYRRTVAKYPGVSTVLLHGGLLPNARRLVTAQLVQLEAAGFSARQARRAYAAYHLLVLGRLTVDEARHSAADRGPAHESDPAIDAYLRELSSKAAFDEATRVLLDGMERELGLTASG